MATDGSRDARSDLVRAFDRWPKAVRLIIFALAVSFAVVMTISYLAQGRWGMALLWVIITVVWSMISMVRLGEADRYARRRGEGTSGL